MSNAKVDLARENMPDITVSHDNITREIKNIKLASLTTYHHENDFLDASP